MTANKITHIIALREGGYMQINTMAETLLNQVHCECSKLFGDKLKDVYLYGSYARGDYDEESDVDFLLTVDMDSNELNSYRESIASISSDLSLEYGITVSITAKPLALFNKYRHVLPYYSNVINEGVLYAG